jgi:TolB-like protein/DNA-binding winged helix-turn-helix (wHTH) protein
VGESSETPEDRAVQGSQDRPQFYRFDVFEVDVLAHELRKEGVRVRLQEQPFQILLLLLDRAGKVVTRDDLRQRIWPSNVFVDFDHGLTNAMARLRDALGETASMPRFIETVQRVGYRFLQRVECVQGEDVATNATPSPPSSNVQPAARPLWSRRKRLALAVSVAAALSIAALLSVAPRHAREGANTAAEGTEPEPSLAVLPFVNLGSDAEDDGFSDGLTEEVSTKLAEIRGLKVVARTDSYRFKGTKEPAAAIAKALHVNHLLEGSVRRSGDHLRITAQLIDARERQSVWSQTFDEDAGDIFRIQEDIAFAVAAALKVSLFNADALRVRRRGTSDPEAYRLYLIAQAQLTGRTRVPDTGETKRALDEAIRRDPNFSLAYAALARYYLSRTSSLPDVDENMRLSAAAAERAVALDPNASEAQQAQANVEFRRYRFRDDYQAYVAATRDMQRAIELDPTNGLAFDDFGRAILWDDPQLALSLFEREVQLDPSCIGGNIMVAVLLGSRGQLDTARKRCAEQNERSPDDTVCRMAIATLETYFGNFPTAVDLLQASVKSTGGAARIQLWSVFLSMGDADAARQWLDFGGNRFEKPLSDAARFAMDGRYAQAFDVLQRGRASLPQSNLLDLPAEKFALLSGNARQALAILEQRVPDLARGIEPISARNLLPALDLATALILTGATDDANALLKRITMYLDGATDLRLPMFAFERARADALAGQPEAALRDLDRAYDEGLRTTWAIDLRPQSMLYIDPISADPAFDTLRKDQRFSQWMHRIAADNAHQLEELREARARETGASTSSS